MTTPVKRYRIPDSRLPFVNAEIATVMIRDELFLVSSIWGGSAGGRIYFWNPDTQTTFHRQLPDDIPGAYMLQSGPDGNLYLGCGQGDLVRYRPSEDRFETLVTGALHGITWGGCVTDSLVVWAANPGHVSVYNWREDRLLTTFRPIDSQEPTALYGHHVLEAADGTIILGMNVPQARLVTLDPQTLAARSHTPVELLGAEWTQDLIWLDEDRLALLHGHDAAEMLVFEYPGFKLLERIPAPAGVTSLRSQICQVGGRYYALGQPDGTLHRLDEPVGREGGAWNAVVTAWTGGEKGVLSPWGGASICAVTISGMTYRYDTASGETTAFDLVATGPMGAHALCAIPDSDLVVGAPFINQRFWTLNTRTGEGGDCGRAAPGGGQINQIVWDAPTQRALLSSYTTSSITAFDPTQPAGWPHNPRWLASAAADGQMRPMALVHDGRHVWMATSPNYGTLGGALCRLDPQRSELRVWRHIVPDQKPNALVVDAAQRLVYVSTEISADCDSAPPTQTTAQLVAFHMDTLNIQHQQAVRANVPRLLVRALLPDGSVLVQEGDQLHRWDVVRGAVVPLGNAPAGLVEVIADGHGGLWASTQTSIGRLSVGTGASVGAGESVQFEPVLSESGRFLQIVNDHLYYANGFHICAFPL